MNPLFNKLPLISIKPVHVNDLNKLINNVRQRKQVNVEESRQYHTRLEILSTIQIVETDVIIKSLRRSQREP
jgi:hypothetical protein